MPRKKATEQNLTPLELEIMSVLWETGPANVQNVQAALKGRELAYTTVQTMLNVLHRKGKVKRELKDRAYVYRPVLSRKTAVTQALGDMLDRFFGGSADGLVMTLVETRHLTPEKLEKLQQMLKENEHGKD
ncbi:MAG TPA: BlaI/MecI/CopY family transcriptional regulator [Bryobacteraceae bacterium]|nr:BlaI/MecI/CopY family transcriptional regulator [Bryobacteraceae bacterium]